MMDGKKESRIIDVPCGNTCALVGVDDKIKKQATIVDKDNKNSHNIKMMKFTFAPIVKVAVRPKNPNHIQKLKEGLIKLAKSDPLVLIKKDSQTKQDIIAGCGDLHLEICI